MGETRRYDLGAQLDIPQILVEAQHRWLRPAEICEILQNHKKFVITPEPAIRPPNGSLFLFDRKVLRYFRKDGHNWRKKKDGKTVKEAHERLKAGSIDVLHCYYAHGEENESFQRRSYWLLEEERSNIVLVHYREVKGNRTNFNRIKEVGEPIPNSLETEESTPISEVDTSVSSKFHPYNYQVTSQSTDTTSLNSTQASEYEDAESAYNQPSSSFHSFLGLQTPGMARMDDALAVPYHPASFSDDYQGNFPAISEMDFVALPQGDNGRNSFDSSLTYEPQGHLDFPSWENILEIQSASFQPSHSSTQPDTVTNISRQRNELAGTIDAFGRKHEFGNHPHVQEERKTYEGNVSHTSNWSMNQKLPMESAYNYTSRFHEGEISSVDLFNSLRPTHLSEKNKHTTLDNPQIHGSSLKQELESNLTVEGKANHSSLKQPLLGNFIKEGLKKLDSFDRWMSKELGDVNDSQMQSSSGVYWDVIQSEDGVDDSSIAPQAHLDNYILSPSLSQDQLFSIIDFSPNWAYTGSEMKVLITGRFLKSEHDMEKCKWACMFGELEVPAEVVADGVLRCHTPKHEGGRVPFYVTCSNRLSCSEVREFEFRVNDVRDMDFTDISRSEILLHTRFQNFLSLGPVSDNVSHDPILSSELSSLLKEDENVWDQMMLSTSEDDFTVEKVRDKLLQKLLKKNLYAWLLQKTGEGGRGPNVLDEGGQGVLHFAAALGYDWAIAPTIAAGVSINFRDVNGWTALHWAASCGRERTVGLLISLDASPGAVTDPTPKYPSGRTPADLASSNGHKGIAGYLAESALSSHLLSLKLKDTKDDNTGDFSRVTAVSAISDRTPTPISDGDLSHGLSLKDSLAAVCHATQAAARIHQVFRVQSFQKKQQIEYGDGDFGLSDERALSLLAVKSNRSGQQDEPVHSAAIRIQNKFRSWKGRKEYLIIRQRIVKIQAHVRGHQVRKNYRKIIWSVGILDKVILRWRRKGSGLRGFKPEALPVGPAMKEMPSKEDDYDFLKEGRKQSEERMQKALARVKSMVQYPEARDQYRRLLNVVTEIQGAKAANDRALNSSAEGADFDDLIDIQSFLDDDTIMSTEY